MEEQLNSQYDIDTYLGHLEDLSSKIADNISLGHFNDVTKLDIERKYIINKISKDVSKLNDNRKKRLKLVWVNNNKMIKNLEEKTHASKNNFNKFKKTVLEYSKHTNS